MLIQKCSVERIKSMREDAVEENQVGFGDEKNFPIISVR